MIFTVVIIFSTKRLLFLFRKTQPFNTLITIEVSLSLFLSLSLSLSLSYSNSNIKYKNQSRGLVLFDAHFYVKLAIFQYQICLANLERALINFCGPKNCVSFHPIKFYGNNTTTTT